MSRAKSRDKNPRVYFCYLLRCADGTLYTGFTDNLARRLQQHNRGKAAKYTRSRRPVRLVWFEPQPTLSAARKREAQIKSRPRADKLQLAAASRHIAQRRPARRSGV